MINVMIMVIICVNNEHPPCLELQVAMAKSYRCDDETLFVAHNNKIIVIALPFIEVCRQKVLL